MNWKRALLTDSGGFQMVSLLKLAEITEEGVKFRSPYDDSECMLTPEHSIQIQVCIHAWLIGIKGWGPCVNNTWYWQALVSDGKSFVYLLFQHHLLSVNWTFSKGTLWQKPTFYSKIPWNLTNVNYVKYDILRKVTFVTKAIFRV